MPIAMYNIMLRLTNVTSVVCCTKDEFRCSVVPRTDVRHIRFTLHQNFSATVSGERERGEGGRREREREEGREGRERERVREREKEKEREREREREREMEMERVQGIAQF